MNNFTYSRGTEFKNIQPGQQVLDRFGQSMSVTQVSPKCDLTCLVDFGGPKPLTVMVNRTMTFGMLRAEVLKKLHGTTKQIKDVRITYKGS